MQLVSRHRLSALHYTDLLVEIPKGTPRYIDEITIRRVVEEYCPDIASCSSEELNIDELEEYVEAVSCIKNAEVYVAVSGEKMNFNKVLKVKVWQREPVVRVIGNNANYYMDEEGVKIDAAYTYSAKVLLVSGHADEQFVRNELLPIVEFVRSSDFWNAQIKHIEVNSQGELRMIPLLGEQVIIFGKPERYKEKFRNLYALYQQGLNNLGWDKYKAINLSYENQVVCVKK